MLIKAHYNLISVILAFSLLALLANFNISEIMHWLSLVVLVIALTLHVLVYLERHNKKGKNVELLQNTYKEFLSQKDKRIDELQKKSDILLKTAMKKSDNELELAELKRKWEEKMKENS